MQKERVYTEEKWKTVNFKNKSLLKDYLTELKSNKRSPGTIQTTHYNLRMIFCYIHDALENKYILDLTKRDFRRIKMWLMDERGLSPAGLNKILSNIHTLLDYAEDDEEYNYSYNVSRLVKPVPKEYIKDVYFLSDEQISELRDLLKIKRMFMHMCLLDFLYDSAARRGEIHQIKREGLLERNHTNLVRGKGGKYFHILYFSRSKESLKLYLDERTDDLEELWVTKKKGVIIPASYDVLYSAVCRMRKEFAIANGIYIPFNVHSFRHSSLENLKRGTHYLCKELNRPNGFTLQELKVHAHHEDTSMTEYYLKKNDNDIIANMFGIKME